MNSTTKLPENTTEWRQACEQAVAYANAHANGLIEFAEAFLERRGWEYIGFESVSLPEASREMEYLNTGETYTPTVCHENGKCFVSSWGDWLEKAEREYCQAENVILCANCGEFTPYDGETIACVCESCGYSMFFAK
jgi:hypothetical protein